MMETKVVESEMFLIFFDILTKDVNFLMDRSLTAPAQVFEQPIHDSDMTACALCSSYEYAEIECPRYEGLMTMNDRVRPPQLIAGNLWPERTPQPPAYTTYYNNYNNQNYKRGNTTHPAQNEATLATNELLQQMLQEQREQMQELRTEMETMKMMMGGQSQQSYTTTDKQKGKMGEVGSSDREAGQFPTQPVVNPRNLHFSVNKHNVHEVNSKGLEL
ncbi:unnamed protein product [Spirodela intermedia]|uniref:Uncharacterized protein n=2 Tax=Spirodela intermedia TaxID=51605 RepID=A0A7I8I8P7_SPIIN|nr:unnamed protein product [Spirodela intermedia]CAA6654036.1 unnamed protein product [Spirodela intermedia]CAA7388498.1 unnamed protein product [Spirodela intermedia]